MNTPTNLPGTEIATLAGGCFWCVEAVFEQLRGVQRVESGFAGGHVLNATYDQVCRGDTGHAEVVQVHFDPAVISFAELLEVFFVTHDPTTLNRQGADVGEQYRSAVFYHTPEQQTAAAKVIAAFTEAKLWPNPIVTQVVPFDAFIKADAHHQGYYRRHAATPYCQMVIAPKVAKARKVFVERLKA
jgi:peptide-methionine (S)-S-oxide reductase